MSVSGLLRGFVMVLYEVVNQSVQIEMLTRINKIHLRAIKERNVSSKTLDSALQQAPLKTRSSFHLLEKISLLPIFLHNIYKK